MMANSNAEWRENVNRLPDLPDVRRTPHSLDRNVRQEGWPADHHNRKDFEINTLPIVHTPLAAGADQAYVRVVEGSEIDKCLKTMAGTTGLEPAASP
jgi:hypothetical protein